MTERIPLPHHEFFMGRKTCILNGSRRRSSRHLIERKKGCRYLVSNDQVFNFFRPLDPVCTGLHTKKILRLVFLVFVFCLMYLVFYVVYYSGNLSYKAR